MSILRAASCSNPRQVRSVPRVARTGRAPTELIGSSRVSGMVARRLLPQAGHDEVAEVAVADRGDRHEPVARQVRVVGAGSLAADGDLDRVGTDHLLAMTLHAARRLASGRVVVVPPGLIEGIAEDAWPQLDDGRDGEVVALGAAGPGDDPDGYGRCGVGEAGIVDHPGRSLGRWLHGDAGNSRREDLE